LDREVVVRILQVRVERVGVETANRGTLVAMGRDPISGWRIGFVVPPPQRQRVIADLARGVHPVVSVPEYDAIPWRSVGDVDWDATS
jgi:hypothetical protein